MADWIREGQAVDDRPVSDGHSVVGSDVKLSLQRHCRRLARLIREKLQVEENGVSASENNENDRDRPSSDTYQREEGDEDEPEGTEHFFFLKVIVLQKTRWKKRSSFFLRIELKWIID